MTEKRPEPKKNEPRERKKYVKPECKRMNEKVGKGHGLRIQVPMASPVVSGTKVF
jgi:hypothetical protein